MPILKIEGRFINSSYDPVREAQLWLKNQVTKLNDFNKIIILGLGNIYHCFELRNAFPDKEIIILEVDGELLNGSLAHFNALTAFQIFHISKASDIFGNSKIMDASENIFCTLRLPSTQILNKGIFDEIETLLTGRSSYALTQFGQARREYKSQIDFHNLPSDQVLSVKDIASAFRNSDERLTKERRVLYILEELIR